MSDPTWATSRNVNSAAGSPCLFRVFYPVPTMGDDLSSLWYEDVLTPSSAHNKGWEVTRRTGTRDAVVLGPDGYAALYHDGERSEVERPEANPDALTEIQRAILADALRIGLPDISGATW